MKFYFRAAAILLAALSLQAVAEGRDPGDISTMEDQTVLAQIKIIIEQSAKP